MSSSWIYNHVAYTGSCFVVLVKISDLLQSNTAMEVDNQSSKLALYR